MFDIFDERRKAQEIVGKIARSMARAGAIASPNDKNKSRELALWVREFAANQSIRDEIGVPDGVVVTPLLWIDGPLGIVARMALVGDEPYDDPRFVIRLKNTSASPLVVKTDVQTITVRGINLSEGSAISAAVASDRGKREMTRIQEATVEPGATIDLSAIRAAQAIQEHSYRGRMPELWGESGAIPQRVDLLEVGYALPPTIDEQIAAQSSGADPSLILGGEMAAQSSRRRKAQQATP